MHWNLSKLSIYKYPSSGTALVSPQSSLSSPSSVNVVVLHSVVPHLHLSCAARVQYLLPTPGLAPSQAYPSLHSAKIPISKLVRRIRFASGIADDDDGFLDQVWQMNELLPELQSKALYKYSYCQWTDIYLYYFLNEFPTRKLPIRGCVSLSLSLCPLALATVNHVELVWHWNRSIWKMS